MSQQYLKISKNSQSATVQQNSGNAVEHNYQNYHEASAVVVNNVKTINQQQNMLQKGKSEVKTFQSKKLNRRDLNLIPPSAAIVQSSNQGDPYASNNLNSHQGGGYQLTLNSTQNKNKASAWDNIGGSRVTTVKHEKGLPNGTIMQCLKQFQRTKQQRQGHHQPSQQEQAEATGDKPGISLQSVTPVASQNVANMPVSTKSNKSQKSTKTRTQIANNASMAAEAQIQRRQNFTCTTTTKGSLRLTKKSPSNGRDPGQANNVVVNNHQGRIQQQRERSSNTKQSSTNQNNIHHQHSKNTRGSASQQHNASEKMSRQLHKTTKKQAGGAVGTNPSEIILNQMDGEMKFAMLNRIREERSNESKPELVGDSHNKLILLTQSNNPYDPVKLISPNTTTNRQSSQEAKLLTLKNFMPAKQINSNVVTPKYLKCKLGNDKSLVSDILNKQDDSNEIRNQKVQSKSQISTHKPSKNANNNRGEQQQVYGTVGSSPESKVQQTRSGADRQQNVTKSLSNNSRQKYSTQQQPIQNQNQNVNSVSKSVNKPSSTTHKGNHHLQIKQKSSGVAVSQQPTAPQIRYSVPPDPRAHQSQPMNNVAQAQQQIQSSSSALNGSSELQKRFTRGEIGSHHDASVSSGKANKSFQFGHNTALMSCSSGGDSSNPPQQVRRRSSSGKNGKQQIKISQIQNVNPVIIQPGTCTSATNHQIGDVSYQNLRKTVPQSTTNTQKSGKRFTFTLNPKDQQKASRPNKHSNTYNTSSTNKTQSSKPQATNAPIQTSQQTATVAAMAQQQQQQQLQQQRELPGGLKSATKGKSVSAKKGKGQSSVQGGTAQASAAQNLQSSQQNNNNFGSAASGSGSTTSKNITFEKRVGKNSGAKQIKGSKMDYEIDSNELNQQQFSAAVVKQSQQQTRNSIKTKIPIHRAGGVAGLSNSVEATQSQTHVKLSGNSTPNSSQVRGLGSKDRIEARSINSRNLSGEDNLSKEDAELLIYQRESIANESSQELVRVREVDPIMSTSASGQKTEFKRLAEELQTKDNLIQQLYNALGRKDDQLNALTMNCEHLSTSLKARDEKRDRSQQAIKETLKNLEQKLQMFTAQSQHNQGGLRQITQSPYEAMRMQQHSNNMNMNPDGLSSPDNDAAIQTPNLSKQRMEPFQLNFQHSQQQQQRPTSSTLLTQPQSKGFNNNAGGNAWDASKRRPSQISEIDSLITVAEYMGTQYDGYKESNYELSTSKKEQMPFVGEPTIGSLASDIQLTNKPFKEFGDKSNAFPLFKKNNQSYDADDMGELTSLSEMEMSNVHDASLDQLERDLMETQHKLQEQSQKASAFVKTQQNNFIDLKANLQAVNDKHVIFETAEEEADEDDIALLIPKKQGSNNHLAQTQKISFQKIQRNMQLIDQHMAPDMQQQDTLQSQGLKHGSEAFIQAKRQVLNYQHPPSNGMTNSKNAQDITKLSKTQSKNKMKLKLAAEIMGFKKDQQMLQQVQTTKNREEDNSISDIIQRTKAEHSRDAKGKKKIQLPLKINSKGGSDSNRLILQNKSQERGTLSNNSASGQGTNQVFNSVTIRNIKNNIKQSSNANVGGANEESNYPQQKNYSLRQPQSNQRNVNSQTQSHLPAKSPQSRQGMQIQGQGNMVSHRLTVKGQSQQQQVQQQKVDKPHILSQMLTNENVTRKESRM